MKKTIICLLSALVLLQSCEKSNVKTNVETKETINEDVKRSLLAKYPDADNIVWRTKNDYLIADFNSNATKSSVSKHSHSAWFNNSGRWCMTETEITFENLPEAVKTAFLASEYASFRIDDIDKIERLCMETIYVIEVENNNLEIDLYYSPDGILTKAVVDVDKDYDYEDYIPTETTSSIDSYIQKNFPGARIIEKDNELQWIEVDIIYNRSKYELMFSLSGEWISTTKDVRRSEIPADIKSALANSIYSSYRIDDIEYFKSNTEEYYEFELESGNIEVEIRIKMDGSIVEVKRKVDNDHNGNSGNGSGNGNGNNNGGNSGNNGGNSGSGINNGNGNSGNGNGNGNGTGVCRDTEYDVNFQDLPEIIKNAFNASEYRSFRIDDIEYHRRNNAEYYEFELESGNIEVEIRIKMDGSIVEVKREIDND